MIESTLEQNNQNDSPKASLSSEISGYIMREIEKIDKELDRLLFPRPEEEISAPRSFLDKFKIWRKNK